jgi:hypothetical protein
MPGPTLCVFARRPERGQVKTRLAAEIGEEAALEAYRECLRAVAAQCARIAPQGGDRALMVFGTPEGSVTDLAAYFPRWSAFLDQGGGDLGARMQRAFRLAGPAVLIGTDAPDLPDSHLERAFADVLTHDVVLGPAEDGGYVLIGLRAPRPELFRDIPWSTPGVMAATLERAKGLSASVLPPWYDVDTRADLERWKRGR